MGAAGESIELEEGSVSQADSRHADVAEADRQRADGATERARLRVHCYDDIHGHSPNGHDGHFVILADCECHTTAYDDIKGHSPNGHDGLFVILAKYEGPPCGYTDDDDNVNNIDGQQSHGGCHLIRAEDQLRVVVGLVVVDFGSDCYSLHGALGSLVQALLAPAAEAGEGPARRWRRGGRWRSARSELHGGAKCGLHERFLN